MARKVEVTDLIDAQGIADRLGVGRQMVHQWRTRHPDFPEPIAVLTRVLVWSWADVERWARDTERLR